jgi:hypothetical protein
VCSQELCRCRHSGVSTRGPSPVVDLVQMDHSCSCVLVLR